MINLDIAAFRAWLEAQRPGATVGTAFDCGACPIAAFILSQPGIDAAQVYDTEVEYVSNERIHAGWVPEWVQAFIIAVDASGVRRITAAAAMEILGRVERMEGLVN